MKRKPSKSSFYNPSFGQNFEHSCFISFHNFQCPTKLKQHPFNQFTQITSIGKYLLNTCKIFILQRLHYFSCSNTIMDIRSMNNYNHNQPKRINNNMTFSPFELLAAIVTNITFTKITCLYALAINNTNRWCRFFANAYSNLFYKNIVRLFNQSLSFPFTEVIINRFPRGKIDRKHSPLYSAFSNVKKSVHNISERIFSLTLTCINNIFYNLPLAFCQIAWIGFHFRLFYWLIQTEEIYQSADEGLFTFYSLSFVNQPKETFILKF